MAEPFIGEIHIYPYTYPPYSWADCNGQQMTVQQNQALYAVIGNAYGGTAPTTFNLPNLMGKIPVGQGLGAGLTNRVIGKTSGTQMVTLNGTQAPYHNHSLSFERDLTELPAPSGNYPGIYRQGTTAVFLYDTDGSTHPVQLSPNAITATGGNGAHSNLQPYMVLRFCIALQGNFPMRN
jgi:microcystin-dependent protein